MNHGYGKATQREWALVILCVTSLALATAAFINSTAGVGEAAPGAGAAAIEPGSITSRHLADGTIRSRDLRNDGIRAVDIKNESLTKRDVKDGSLSASDLLFYVVEGPSVATSNNVINTSVATCHGGDMVLGGGYLWFGFQPDLQVGSFQPQNTSSGWEWETQAVNRGSDPINFQGYATCVQE